MQEETFQNARFMIVDDEPVNIAVLEGMLREWKCLNVKATTDSRLATTLFTEYQPDIVLLDLTMPHLDGFEVMEQLRAIMPANSWTPILVLTGHTSTQVKRRALAAGARDFLSKPLDAMELFLRIWNLLETRYLHLEILEQNQSLEKKVHERTEKCVQAEKETAACMARAGEYRDDDTGSHTQRVGLTAALLARHLGLDDTFSDLIWHAAPLHDVGKIGIPDSILLKPGSLNDEEFVTMKTHTTIGSDILKVHKTPILQMAASIALSHHERWDGSGYPNGLKGPSIPIEGRIVALADVFDALTHDRPYHKAWTPTQARDEIRDQEGRQFDPQVVEAFMQAVPAAR